MSDAVRLFVVDDNHIDILIPGAEGLQRTGLLHHFDPKESPLQAEFGIAIFVEVDRGNRTWRYLFDMGLSGPVLLHNLLAMGLDFLQLDGMVLSHGHPDHYGGIFDVLDALPHDVPVYTHKDAFLVRNIKLADGCMAPYYNFALRHDDLLSRGAHPVLGKHPIDIGPGLVVSGEIPRNNDDFEGPHRPQEPGADLTQVREDGRSVLDEVWDELALYVEIPGSGFLTLSGCSHAGPINAIQHGQTLHAGAQSLGFVGGMHLGLPGVPLECKTRTVEELRKTGTRFVMPGHCTGAEAIGMLRAELSDVYVECSVGTRMTPGVFVENR
jgi:7,8-dihydropterin-6-yl-methyl-4-(beta-D-ribofuranosyl)aminobenzene 5'-phosphate synthase